MASFGAAAFGEGMEGFRCGRRQGDCAPEVADGTAGAPGGQERDAEICEHDRVVALRLEDRKIGVGLLGMASERVEDRGEMVPRQRCARGRGSGPA